MRSAIGQLYCASNGASVVGERASQELPPPFRTKSGEIKLMLRTGLAASHGEAFVYGPPHPEALHDPIQL
jgi:hypothetical protein